MTFNRIYIVIYIIGSNYILSIHNYVIHILGYTLLYILCIYLYIFARLVIQYHDEENH